MGIGEVLSRSIKSPRNYIKKDNRRCQQTQTPIITHEIDVHIQNALHI